MAVAFTPQPDLVARIRAEFLELPGLRLTLAQARRLFGPGTFQVEEAIDELVRQGFLRWTRDGALVRADMAAGARDDRAGGERAKSA